MEREYRHYGYLVTFIRYDKYTMWLVNIFSKNAYGHAEHYEYLTQERNMISIHSEMIRKFQ